MRINFTAMALAIFTVGLIVVMSLRGASEPWERGMYPCRYFGVEHWCQEKGDKIQFYMRTVTGAEGRLVATLSRKDARNSAD